MAKNPIKKPHYPKLYLRKHINADHHHTNSDSRFLSGPIVAQGGLLAGHKCQVSGQHLIFKHSIVHGKKELVKVFDIIANTCENS